MQAINHGNKATMRSFSNSPIAMGIAARNALLFFVQPAAFILLVARDISPWWGLSILVTALALQVAVLVTAGGHRGYLRAAKQLHARLPWFRAEAFTWLPADQLPQLRTELANARLQVHEIDGASVRTVADLAAALERQFGARSFPADPVAKTVAILTKLGEKRRDAHAIVLRGASELATGDAESFTRLVAGWVNAMHVFTPHVLVFLVRGTEIAAAPQVTDATAASEVPEVAAVRADGWWRSKPGELARG